MKSRKSLYRLVIITILCINLVSLGCAAKQVPGTSHTSQEAQTFKAVSIAFDAYDLAMSSLRMLQTNKIITLAKYNSIKDQYAWPLYRAIVAAQAAAEAYAKAPGEATLAKVTAALIAVADSQREFTKTIQSVQGGK